MKDELIFSIFYLFILLFLLAENPILILPSLLPTNTSSMLYLLNTFAPIQAATIAIVIIFICVVFVIKARFMEHKIKAIVIFLLISSLSIFWIPFSPPDANNTNLLYLLSSISQGLSAAFTLIITITLISSQILVKYGSETLDRVFSSWVLKYIVFFIFSIILPLIIIFYNNYENLTWIKLSLNFFIICLILLIPYIFWFKEVIKPENIVRDYIERSERLWTR